MSSGMKPCRGFKLEIDQHKTKGFKQACDIEDSSEAEGSGQRVSRKEVFGPQDDGDVDVKVSESECFEFFYGIS